MVYTNQILVFARLGDDELADIVPLKEILSVKVNDTGEEPEVDPFDSFTDKSPDDSDAVNAECTLEINTLPDGYNSGRIFKIRLNSKKDQQAIVEDLARFSVREREKTEVKSKYKQTQDKIAIVLDSNMVQMFLAFLITMVRSCADAKLSFGA